MEPARAPQGCLTAQPRPDRGQHRRGAAERSARLSASRFNRPHGLPRASPCPDTGLAAGAAVPPTQAPQLGPARPRPAQARGRPCSVLTQHEGAEAAGHALGQVVHVQLHRVQRRRLLHGDARPPAGRRNGRCRGAAPNTGPESAVRAENATAPLRTRNTEPPPQCAVMRRRGSGGAGRGAGTEASGRDFGNVPQSLAEACRFFRSRHRGGRGAPALFSLPQPILAELGRSYP